MKEEEILYLYDKDGQCKIKFYNGDVQTLNMRCSKVMEKMCFHYGRNTKQIRVFVSSVLKIRQKVPLLLDVKEKVIFFPVYSISAKENIWIQYRNIKCIKEDIHRCCEVHFKNKEKLTLPCEKRSIQRQRRRCRKLLQLLKQSIV